MHSKLEPAAYLVLQYLKQITQANVDMKPSTFLSQVKPKHLSDPVFEENDIEIYFSPTIKGKVEFYAHIKNSKIWFLIKDKPVLIQTNFIAELSDSMYSVLTAKMLGLPTNMEVYLRTLDDIFPEKFDSQLLMTSFDVIDETYDQLKESLDSELTDRYDTVIGSEEVVKDTETYTAYLLSIKREKGVFMLSRYLFVIDFKNILGDHILACWAKKAIYNIIQTF